MRIINANIVTIDTVLDNYYVDVTDGFIESLGPMTDIEVTGEAFDAKGGYLCPGAIDIHVHGSQGLDAMDADSESITGIQEALQKTGVTSFLLTTMTESEEKIEAALESVRQHEGVSSADLLGVHLEGPFINPKYKGAQNEKFILPPTAELMEKYVKLSGDKIRVVTYAPELDENFRMTKYLYANKIRPSVGHSDATYEVLLEASKHGLNHVTHFYNGMRGLHHREPGVVGFGFMGSPFVELIVDGVHASPDMVKFAYHVIGPERLMLITDAMKGQGLNSGEYEFGGQTVVIEDGVARLTTGSLAGSVIEMHQAIQLMKDITGCSWSDIVRMTAHNQAMSLGLTDRGAIEVNKRADFALYDESSTLINTAVKGQWCYE